MGGNEIIEVIKEEKKKGEFFYVRVMSELNQSKSGFEHRSPRQSAEIWKTLKSQPILSLPKSKVGINPTLLHLTM